MRRIVFLLVLGLISMATASRAQGDPNHLSGQTSPYLRRAVSQPVDWHPWGADVFQRARALNRPILLDVGAVWCPWCNLMDRETYTNIATADYINQHFVSVKVDFDAAPELLGCLSRLSSHQTESSTLARDTCPLSAGVTNRPFERQRKRL